MKTRIQLEHPAGKQTVTMDAGKYDVMCKAILGRLAQGGSTHTEMLRAIRDDFAASGTQFQGSVEWHMQWVKLDLEARKEIKRTEDLSPVRFALA